MPITINGSTGISGVDGSAGTPALSGSDADTGLLFAAGQVQASLNGTAANVGLVQATAQASTSGTSIDFTGIPSWAKRITVMLSGVSTNGTSPPVLRLGTSGGIQTTGYTCINSVVVSSAVTVSDTTGFLIGVNTTNWSAGVAGSGMIVLAQISSGSGVWSCMGAVAGSGSTYFVSGAKTLSGTLDRVRITTANGTDAFDAGSINILYE
jgi:hypothetical protein